MLRLHGRQRGTDPEPGMAPDERRAGGGKARHCSPAVAAVGSGEAASNPDSSDYRGPGSR